jgi:hypothetical protein
MKTLSFTIVLALLPAAVSAAERPDWAFPPAGVTGAPRKPDTGELKRVPGSTQTYTQSQIDSFNDPPDWFPDQHPPMPAIGRTEEDRRSVPASVATSRQASDTRKTLVSPARLQGISRASSRISKPVRATARPIWSSWHKP